MQKSKLRTTFGRFTRHKLPSAAFPLAGTWLAGIVSVSLPAARSAASLITLSDPAVFQSTVSSYSNFNFAGLFPFGSYADLGKSYSRGNVLFNDPVDINGVNNDPAWSLPTGQFLSMDGNGTGTAFLSTPKTALSTDLYIDAAHWTSTRVTVILADGSNTNFDLPANQNGVPTFFGVESTVASDPIVALLFPAQGTVSATQSEPLIFDFATGSSQPLTVSPNATGNFPPNTGSGIKVVQLPGLTIGAGGHELIPASAAAANRQLLAISGSGLSIAGGAGNWTAVLDLSNNDIDLPGASLATVSDQVRQGFNNGNWNGTGGIISSSAAASTAHLTTLGVIQNNQNGSPLFTTFDTDSVGASDVLVKYTFYGDTNLDGRVDGSDYSRIDNGSLQHLTGWYNGDFNYDGVIDGSDYTLIDNAFNAQGASLAAETVPAARPTAEITGSAVPEPASLLTLTTAGFALLGRRKNRG